MVYDPTETDAEKICKIVDEEFPESWVMTYDHHGKTILKVEPPSGKDAEQDCEQISNFLSKKGLNTEINCVTDDETVYEVIATAENW